MNERIEKLAEQCRIETYGVNGELLEFGFDEEKFALLIVRECASYMNEFAVNGDIRNGDDLLKHFGVEE